MLVWAEYVFIQKSQQGGGSPMSVGFRSNKIVIVVDWGTQNYGYF